MTPTKRFVELNKSKHDRQSFECGSEELNQFIRRYALQHRHAGISKTTVLPARKTPGSDLPAICSYYTLSHTEIERQALPKAQSKKLPFYPVPVLLIGQLAINTGCQGQGLGKITLVRALRHCLEINAHLPSYAVIVDALEDDVQAFYEQYGFSVLDIYNGRTRLYLPMKTIEQLFG